MPFRYSLAGIIAATLTGLTLLALRSSGSFSHSDAGSPRTAPTALQVDRPVHDFGEVLQSASELVHRFELVNRGELPLRLRVRGVGCNCLQVECPEEIPPGASMPCTARLDLGHREGPLHVPAIVVTDEPGNPQLTISIRCEIIPDIRIEPVQLEFRDVRKGAVLSADCAVVTALVSDADRPDSVVAVTSCAPGVQCDLIESGRPDGAWFTLERRVSRFRLRIDTREISPHNEIATLPSAVRFSCREGSRTVERSLACRMEFRRHDHLSAPRTIAVRRGQSEPCRFTLSSHDGELFVVTELVVSDHDGTIVVDTPSRNPAIKHILGLRCAPVTAVQDNTKSSSIQKFAAKVHTDRWPGDPFEFEVLLLP